MAPYFVLASGINPVCSYVSACLYGTGAHAMLMTSIELPIAVDKILFSCRVLCHRSVGTCRLCVSRTEVGGGPFAPPP